MAAYTASTSGSWSSPGTWGDAGPPGAGDTVTIGGYTVTVEGTVSVGTGSGVAVQLNEGATLTVVTGGTLSVAGKVRMGDGYEPGTTTVSLEGGAVLEFDASSGQDCGIALDMGNGSGGIPALNFGGSSGSHCTVRRKATPTGNAPTITAVSSSLANLTATYTDFADFGAASVWGINWYYGNGSSVSSATDCTFTRCNLVTGGDFTLTRCVFAESVNEGGGQGAVYLRSGSATLDTVGLDGPITIATAGADTSVSGCVFGSWIQFGAGVVAPSTWTDNLAAMATELIVPAGTYSRTYWLQTEAMDNPHGVQVIAATTGGVTLDRCITDAPLCPVSANAELNDLYDLFGPNVTLNQCIALPRMAGTSPGFGPSFGFAPAANTKYHHCTICCNAPAHGATIQADAAHSAAADNIAEFLNNLCWAPSGTDSEVFWTDVTGWVTAAGCDYNALVRTIYNVVGLGGAHDVTLSDVTFTDPTRNLLTFYAAQASVTLPDPPTEETVADAVAYMVAHPELVDDLVDWVTAGFAPTNAELEAASDAVAGGWIGAVEGSVASGPTTFAWTGSDTSGEVGSKPTDAAGTMAPVLATLVLVTDAAVTDPIEFTLASDGDGDAFYTEAGALQADGKFTLSSGDTLTCKFNPALIGEKTISATATGLTGDPHTFTGLMQLGITRPVRRNESYDARNHTTPDLGGYVPCLAGPLSEYTRAIDADTVHPHDDLMMGVFGEGGVLAARCLTLAGQAATETGGMPLSVVPGDQTPVTVTFTLEELGGVDTADPGPYPIPDTAGVQSWPNTDTAPTEPVYGDSHCLVFDRDNELEYEGYHCYKDPVNGWTFDNGSIWDMANGGGGYRNEGHAKHCDPGIHRHISYPTITAAGLPILPLSARYDEVALRGSIDHALGVTFLNVKLAGIFVWPARACANFTQKGEVFDGETSYGWPIPYGARLRLKAAWYTANVTNAEPGTWGPQSAVFLECFRKYGMVQVDGSSLFEPWLVADHRWDYTGDLDGLNAVPLSAFEVVEWPVDATVTVDPLDAAPDTARTVTVSYTFHTGENPAAITVDPKFYDGSEYHLCSPWQVSLTAAEPSAEATYTPTAVEESYYWNRAISWDYFAGPVTITTTATPEPPTVSGYPINGCPFIRGSLVQ